MTHIERMLSAKDKLPPMRRRIFEELYQIGTPRPTAARKLGLSDEVFDREHSAMLRSLKVASASS